MVSFRVVSRLSILGCSLALFSSTALSGCVVPLAESPESRTAYIKAHPSLDPKVEKAIRLGKVIRGMSREEVEASFGYPSEIDNSESIGLHNEWGKEVWNYRSDSFFILDPEATVYFHNGKVREVDPSFLSEF